MLNRCEVRDRIDDVRYTPSDGYPLINNHADEVDGSQEIRDDGTEAKLVWAPGSIPNGASRLLE